MKKSVEIKNRRFDPKKLRKFRMELKLTWLELSRGLKVYEPNVSKNSVWGWEKGRHSPSARYLNAMSAFFKRPIDDFMKD